MSGTGRLLWLEAMRGVAAVWVVLHHASNAAAYFLGPLEHDTVLTNGQLGVDFFFVLSGFIIALSAAQLRARGGGLRAYARSRFLRIYVPYWPIGVPLLVAYLVLPSMSASPHAVGVFTSLTLLPSNTPPALSVAWTLVHEVLFYAVFATWFVSRRAFVVVLAAWVALMVGWWWSEAPADIALTYLVSPRNLSFVVGVSVFHARRLADARGLTAGDVPALIIGLAIVGWQAFTLASHVVVTVGFALLVFAGASSFAKARPPPALLVTAGAASYAIYLLHNPLVSVLTRGAARAHLGPWAACVAVSVIASLLGVAWWRFIETPSLRWARARFVAE